MAVQKNDVSPFGRNLYVKLRDAKLLDNAEERRLAEIIRESGANISRFIAEATFIIKFILDRYEAIAGDGDRRGSVEDLIIGFTETEADERSEDPENTELSVLAPQKFALLKKTYGRTIRSIRANGRDDPRTVALRRQLREIIGTFIFTPALFNDIVLHINGQFSRVLDACLVFENVLIGKYRLDPGIFRSAELERIPAGGRFVSRKLHWIDGTDALPPESLALLAKNRSDLAAVKAGIRKIVQLEKISCHKTAEIIAIYNSIKREFARGIEARNIMIQSNIRLVMHEARKFNKDDETFNDLTQYGILGLIRAIEKFDHTMGFKLSTYATCWIRQYMNRALNTDFKSIKLPANKEEKIKKIKKVSINFFKKNGRDPSEAELAQMVKMPAAEIARLKFYSVPTVSLNEAVNYENNGGEELYLENIYHVEDQETPFGSAESEQLNRSIEQALNSLPPQEADILRRRFGIGTDFQTLEEIARIYGVKAERIRQIEDQALKRLKQNSKYEFLKDWAE